MLNWFWVLLGLFLLPPYLLLAIILFYLDQPVLGVLALFLFLADLSN